MKRFRIALTLVLAVCLVMGLCVTASAAGGYKVTVSGGTFGVDYTPGNITSFNPNDYPQAAEVDKYYFKGYHISGQEGIVGSFTVTHDIILVATYGVKGDMVNYTVRYVRAGTGEELFPSETRAGNVGDKPVVSARHLDDFLPNTYNYTFTLEKGVNREIVFYYSPAPVVTPEPANQGNQPNQQQNQQQQGNQPPQQGNQPGNQQIGGATPAPVQPGTPAEQPGTPTEQPSEPVEMIDLDDEDVPLANFPLPGGTVGGQTEQNKKNAWLAAGIGAGGLLALLAALWYALIYRKKKNEE